MTWISSHRLFAVLVLGLTVVSTVSVLDARVHAAPHPANVRTATVQQQAAIDWDAVGQALGKPGQVMAGGVYRVGLPRTDLTVTVEGVPVKASFALGSYAAFEPADDGNVMVMGDLVLLDAEVPVVMDGLMAGGIAVTALHNHLNQITPHVMYLHYEADGDPVQIATALHQALTSSGTPFGSSSASANDAMGTDTSQLEQLLGHTGALNGSVFQVTVPRAETITEMGMVLLPAMGVATSLNFQLMGQGQVAITGDFVLTQGEVNPVVAMLRANGIEVTALHNHALDDQPRLFYMHFWATGDAMTLASGLRAALDQTNSMQTP
jgi:Domain of Unknown Function (DUF1259)